MKIKCGDMFMADTDSKLYAWFVERVWYMPWRYNLHLVYIGKDDEVCRNLNLDGVKGTLKLFDLWEED